MVGADKTPERKHIAEYRLENAVVYVVLAVFNNIVGDFGNSRERTELFEQLQSDFSKLVARNKVHKIAVKTVSGDGKLSR